MYPFYLPVTCAYYNPSMMYWSTYFQNTETESLRERAIRPFNQLGIPVVELNRSEINEQIISNKKSFIPIGQHSLPPLPYGYNALEPYIDEQTMHLHHDIHHQSYVDGLNKAEKQMQKAREKTDFSLIKHWEREVAFNGAGHYLHTIFWHNMHPEGGGTPSSEIAIELEKTFGSFEKFKEHFSAAAEKVEGGGWAILIWSPRSGRTEILQVEQHQNLSQQDMVPLLVLDVWEHAYYLKYTTKRKDYINAWWNIVNWLDVENRFKKARKLIWNTW